LCEAGSEAHATVLAEYARRRGGSSRGGGEEMLELLVGLFMLGLALLFAAQLLGPFIAAFFRVVEGISGGSDEH